MAPPERRVAGRAADGEMGMRRDPEFLDVEILLGRRHGVIQEKGGQVLFDRDLGQADDFPFFLAVHGDDDRRKLPDTADADRRRQSKSR